MDLLHGLNPMQKKAVEATDGPQLIIAGAGSGKTRVITHKIAYLIREKNVPPWRIFAATFTNKAANEMKERVLDILDFPGEVRLHISTFHSLCAAFLRKESHKVGLSPHYTIVDERDQRALIRDCLKQLEIPKEALDPRDGQEYINQAKIHMLDPEDLSEKFYDFRKETVPKLFSLYEKRLRESDAADFGDLILYMVKLLKKDPETRRYYQDRFQYILVDEYQDTNFVQFELVRLLAEGHGNLCVVGDEDQSIYSWRGAMITNLLDFSKRFAGTRIIKLERNYRSTKTILKAADEVIQRNRERIGKTLWTERMDGDPVFLISATDERNEARIVVETILQLHHLAETPLREMAIFYRQNSLSRIVEDEIRRRRLPYKIVGGMRFYDRAVVKDLLAYLKIAVNPNNSIALQRIINVPTRGIGARTIQKLLEIGRERNMTLYQVMKAVAEEKLLSSRAVGKVNDFLMHIREWRFSAAHDNPYDTLRRIIEDTGYLESLGDPKSLEVISNKENILELQNAVQDYFEENPGASLEQYFETLALSAPVDELQNYGDSVCLMTLHSAKGLEFDTVFMIGMEEPIFPNRRTVDETGTIEEERRLFYVGVTRAKNRLFLSRADSRVLHGHRDWNPPSQFIYEVGRENFVEWDPMKYDWRANTYR